MASFINITSNNFSGETAEVYFLPCSGGTLQNLGSQILPIDIVNISEDNTAANGLYQVYLTDLGNRLCEVEVNCSGPGYAFFQGDTNQNFTFPEGVCVNGVYDQLIYSEKTSVSVGDTLYLDSDMTQPYAGAEGFYISLKYSQDNNETTYAIKTDNNGVILEIIDCSTLNGATPTPTPTPLPATSTPTPTPDPTEQPGPTLEPTPIPEATTTPAPTDTPTPTPGPIFREIQLSNPQSSSQNACNLTSGQTKYIDVNSLITNGLVIYNNDTLTTRTYIEDPTGYSLVIDTNGAKYAVTFDGTGAVYSVVDCGNNPTSTPTPVPEATTTPTPVPEGTSTPTPVPEATTTPTPVPEATTTPTPVPEATTTPTPIPSTSLPAPTSTPTPTPTPTLISFNVSDTGVSDIDACGSMATFTAYSTSNNPQLGDTVYSNSDGTITHPTGFYKNSNDQVFELNGVGVVISGPNTCD
jgi:hypothetical protein